MAIKSITIGDSCGETVQISAKQIQYNEKADLYLQNNQEIEYYNDLINTGVVPIDPTYVIFNVLKNNIANFKHLIYFKIKCITFIPPVMPPTLPATVCATYQIGSLIQKAAYGHFVLTNTIVNGKKVYEKPVTNELIGGGTENWVMRWQWDSGASRWNLYKMQSNLYISGVLSISDTSEIVGTTDNLGAIVSTQCECTIICFSSNVLLEGNGDVVSSPSSEHKRYTLDYNYLFEGRETWFVELINGNKFFGYRWRFNGSNWQLMRRHGGIIGNELFFNTLADSVNGANLPSQISVSGYTTSNSTTAANCPTCP
jgi:hypothetical protein